MQRAPRRRDFGAVVTVVVTAFLAACAGPPTPAGDPPNGALVTSVFPTGPADLAGLRPSDVVVGWRSTGGRGTVESPIEARRVEDDLAPRGDLVLELVRDGRPLDLSLPSGRWEAELAAANSGDVDRDSATSTEWVGLADRALARDAVESAQWYLVRAGTAAAHEGDQVEAKVAFDRARALTGSDRPRRLALLWKLEGDAWHEAKAADSAIAAHQRSIELLREHGSPLGLAAALVHLAEISPLPERAPYLGEARTLLEASAGAGVDLAHVINHLGIVAAVVERDLDAAVSLYEEAVGLRERAIPGSYRIGSTCSNLSQCARRQGRLDDAERLVTRALSLYPEVSELATLRAGAFNTLALVQRDKGSYRKARENWEASLALFRDLDPDGPAVAGVLNNLGNLSLRVGDLERAERRYRESLVLRRQLAPESGAVAQSLNNLGIVGTEQGRFDDARSLLLESLRIKQSSTPESESLANTLQSLGELSLRQGRPADAVARMRESLEMRSAITPRSIRTAENLALLGRAEVRAGYRSEGMRHWAEGLELLEELRAGYRFSAQERSIFASRFQDLYRDYAAELVIDGRTRDAFALVEQSRARALRLMASQRVSGRAETRETPLESPSLPWNDVRARLDPGTRLLVYSVGREETLLFEGFDPSHTEDEDLRVHRIAVTRGELVDRVELFRALIARGRSHPTVDPALVGLGRELNDLLFGPLTDLERTERLLIVPDLPLTSLPFAALVRGDGPDYLGAWKPFSFAVSGTAFALAADRRSTSESAHVDVFAHSLGAGSVAGRTAIDREIPDLGPLPGVEQEAERIANLFPERSRIRLDLEATETSLRGLAPDLENLGATPSLDRSVRILHLATHTLIDDRTPLESALLLESDGDQDGLLHAWEVIDSLPLNYDLVTLSACSTGLGRDLGGDGVLGLSHAFMVSGARTVLTSLWPVADRSTADWMEAFYTAVRDGEDRDVAVWRAQRSVLGDGGETRHPYAWAAFQLWGDWASHAAPLTTRP